MSHVEQALDNLLLDRLSQVEQTQLVAHRGARTSDRVRHLLVGQVEFLDQAVESCRLLERIQIFALDILDQRNRRRGFGIQFTNHRRHLLQTRQLRRTPATFTGDQLVMISFRSKDYGLHDTLRTNRISQFLQRLLIEVLPWLKATSLNLLDIDLDQAIAMGLGTGNLFEISDQGTQSPAQSLFFLSHY